MQKSLFLLLLVCLLISPTNINENSGIFVASSSDDEIDVMRFGVNYFSTHNHY
jgi:hypothetical protein